MAIRAVVLDAMGVIYASGDDVGDLLLPFLATIGLPDHRTDRAVVEPLYLACSRGEFPSAELWRRLGVTGPVDGLDDRYLAGHTLDPGLGRFLDAAASRDLRVAALTNDVSEWSLGLRTRFRLGTCIHPWVVSGDVGHRKPAAEIYEALLARLDTPAADIVFVDDRPVNLDAAAALGLRTVLFAPAGDVAGCVAHPVVRSFDELTRLVGAR